MNNLCSAWVGKYKGYHTKGRKKNRSYKVEDLQHIHLSICPPIHLSTHPSVHPFIHSPIYYSLSKDIRHVYCILGTVLDASVNGT